MARRFAFRRPLRDSPWPAGRTLTPETQGRAAMSEEDEELDEGDKDDEDEGWGDEEETEE
jgi:hypothetical protein